MKRYLLGFVSAYFVSLILFLGMLLIAISNWLFSDSPMWFNVLFVIVELLPFLALGEIFGRRAGKTVMKKPLLGLVLLLAVMALLAFLTAILADSVDYIQFIAWPGTLMSGVFLEILDYSGYWDGLFILLGHLLLPLLYHLGWHWGKTT